MKNIQIILGLALLLILSACGAKDTTKEDLSSMANFLITSQQTDQALIETITKAKDNKTSFSDLEVLLKGGRELQQNLYNNIESLSVSKTSTSSQKTTLLYIGEKIASYNRLIQVLSKQNYDLLSESVSQHQTLMGNYEKKTLADINTALETIGEPVTDSFEIKAEAKQ